MKRDKFVFNFLKKLESSIREYKLINDGETVLVAFSGGADSVTLLHSLNSISSIFNIKIIAAHINHGIRENSKSDESFVKEFCSKLGIELFVEKTDIPKIAKQSKKGIEETARIVRYEILEKIAKKVNAKKIATAHNMNDNGETVIFNLVRGAGLKGICGIQEKRGKIIRPLLSFDRIEIEEYLRILDLSFVYDESNSDLIYTRNFIRHEIMPKLNTVNPNAIKNIYNFSRIVALDEEILSNIANSNIKGEEIVNSPSILARKFIQDFKVFSSGLSLSNKHIQQGIDAFNNSSSEEISFSLPGDNAVIIYKNTYRFLKNEDLLLSFDEEKRVSLTPPIDKLYFGDWVLSFGFKRPENNEKGNRDNENVYKNSILITIDFDKIIWSENGKELIIRTRKEGDSFVKHNINRKVKKCFINSKVPKSMRDNIPIICDKEGIIFAPYIGIADRVYTDKPKKPLFIYLYYKGQLGENKNRTIVY